MSRRYLRTLPVGLPGLACPTCGSEVEWSLHAHSGGWSCAYNSRSWMDDARAAEYEAGRRCETWGALERCHDHRDGVRVYLCGSPAAPDERLADPSHASPASQLLEVSDARPT